MVAKDTRMYPGRTYRARARARARVCLWSRDDIVAGHECFIMPRVCNVRTCTQRESREFVE